MPSKSKTKGNAWERELSTFLSKTYNKSFVRVPTSGAGIGGFNSFRKKHMDAHQILARKGDIQAPDTWKYWNAEAKSYNEFPLHHLFSGEVKILDTWISQTLEVADEKDLNIIFLKLTRRGSYVVVQKKCGFDIQNGVNYKDWIFCGWDCFWSNATNVALLETLSENGV